MPRCFPGVDCRCVDGEDRARLSAAENDGPDGFRPRVPEKEPMGWHILNIVLHICSSLLRGGSLRGSGCPARGLADCYSASIPWRWDRSRGFPNSRIRSRFPSYCFRCWRIWTSTGAGGADRLPSRGRCISRQFSAKPRSSCIRWSCCFMRGGRTPGEIPRRRFSAVSRSSRCRRRLL